eukprot:gene1441-1586_t
MTVAGDGSSKEPCSGDGQSVLGLGAHEWIGDRGAVGEWSDVWTGEFLKAIYERKGISKWPTKMICAGDKLQSRSGVLRSCRMARRNPSWLRFPVGPVFDIKRRLAILTATSALPLDWGKLTEEMRWRTFHEWRNVSVLVAVNSGPPSLASSSGTPKVPKNVRKWRIKPVDPARSLPTVEHKTSTQPESLSPTTR